MVNVAHLLQLFPTVHLLVATTWKYEVNDSLLYRYAGHSATTTRHKDPISSANNSGYGFWWITASKPTTRQLLEGVLLPYLTSFQQTLPSHDVGCCPSPRTTHENPHDLSCCGCCSCSWSSSSFWNSANHHVDIIAVVVAVVVAVIRSNCCHDQTAVI